VQELILITENSPWCTIVKNEVHRAPSYSPLFCSHDPAQRGVTLGDICTTVWKEYTENFVTDGEFAALPPRLQEHIKRSAAHAQQGGWNMYYSPAPATNRYRRVDWLRERVYFEGLVKQDQYIVSRLGFKAPNILCMQLTS
jgi:hypothetical protein